MTARERIRAIVDAQLTLLSEVSNRGALNEGELAALQSLTKTAAIADGLEVPKQADETAGLSDAELERRAGG